MHFASHLRSERLGEFTIGTRLHRSDSLALVQLLVLYHLVTAREKILTDGAQADVRTSAAAGRLQGHSHACYRSDQRSARQSFAGPPRSRRSAR